MVTPDAVLSVLGLPPPYGRRVSGIVDRAHARIADPRADLAWTQVVLDFSEPRAIDRIRPTRGRNEPGARTDRAPR